MASSWKLLRRTLFTRDHAPNDEGFYKDVLPSKRVGCRIIYDLVDVELYAGEAAVEALSVERARRANLLRIDGTGLVRVWTSEQVLARLCVDSRLVCEMSGRIVVELGAGRSGLAGFAIATRSPAPKHVLITDGHPDAVELLRKHLDVQPEHVKEIVQVQKLRWDDPECYKDAHGTFDWVVMADCLFFELYHEALLETLIALLVPGGRILYVGPTRGATTVRFFELAHATFEIKEQLDLNETIQPWLVQNPLYRIAESTENLNIRTACNQADWHLPRVFILLKR